VAVEVYHAGDEYAWMKLHARHIIQRLSLGNRRNLAHIIDLYDDVSSQLTLD
jgi:hypothetical protein